MMVGGGLMLLFGLLFMLMVIGLPIVLVVVVAGVWGLSVRRSGSVGTLPGYDRSVAPAASFARYCSHCGQGLQADWTNCPQCGATV
jgi:hypothetical protein